MITLLHHTFEIPYTLYMDIILSPPTQIIFPLNANFSDCECMGAHDPCARVLLSLTRQ